MKRLTWALPFILLVTACEPESTPPPTYTMPPTVPASATIVAVMPTVAHPDIGNVNADEFTPGASSITTPGANGTGTALQPTEVSIAMEFTAGDGLVIAGSYYGAAKRPAPGVLLLHMLGGRKEDWQEVAVQLQGAGYNVLAIDLRGHGMTGGNLDWTKAPGDVKAVFEQFRVLPSMMTEKVSIIGASIGANLALNACADLKFCKAVVLLSPGLDYEGVQTADAMGRYGTRSVMIVASRDDSPSGKDSAALDRLAKGDHKLQLYDGAAHGIAVFDAHPDLARLIIQWLAAHNAA